MPGDIVNISPVDPAGILLVLVLPSIAEGYGQTFSGISVKNSFKVSKSPYPEGSSRSSHVVQSLSAQIGVFGQQNLTL